MVNARLHLICGNCGCSDDFSHRADKREACLVCNNCSTIHDVSDNAKVERPTLPLLPVSKPTDGTKVVAIIKHFAGWEIKTTVLIAVDEDDCDWRFNDGSELAHEWNVIYWEAQT